MLKIDIDRDQCFYITRYGQDKFGAYNVITKHIYTYEDFFQYIIDTTVDHVLVYNKNGDVVVEYTPSFFVKAYSVGDSKKQLILSEPPEEEEKRVSSESMEEVEKRVSSESMEEVEKRVSSESMEEVEKEVSNDGTDFINVIITKHDNLFFFGDIYSGFTFFVAIDTDCSLDAKESTIHVNSINKTFKILNMSVDGKILKVTFDLKSNSGEYSNLKISPFFETIFNGTKYYFNGQNMSIKNDPVKTYKFIKQIGPIIGVEKDQTVADGIYYDTFLFYKNWANKNIDSFEGAEQKIHENQIYLKKNNIFTHIIIRNYETDAIFHKDTSIDKYIYLPPLNETPNKNIPKMLNFVGFKRMEEYNIYKNNLNNISNMNITHLFFKRERIGFKLYDNFGTPFFKDIHFANTKNFRMYKDDFGDDGVSDYDLFFKDSIIYFYYDQHLYKIINLLLVEDRLIVKNYVDTSKKFKTSKSPQGFFYDQSHLRYLDVTDFIHVFESTDFCANQDYCFDKKKYSITNNILYFSDGTEFFVDGKKVLVHKGESHSGPLFLDFEFQKKKSKKRDSF